MTYPSQLVLEVDGGTDPFTPPTSGLSLYVKGGTLYTMNNAAVVNAIGGSPVTPGGANTNIQYNNSGAFGGDANFTWDGNRVVVATAGGLVNDQSGLSNGKMTLQVQGPNSGVLSGLPFTAGQNFDININPTAATGGAAVVNIFDALGVGPSSLTMANFTTNSGNAGMTSGDGTGSNPSNVFAASRASNSRISMQPGNATSGDDTALLQVSGSGNQSLLLATTGTGTITLNAPIVLTNQVSGNATLVAGVAVVSTTAITVGSAIQMTVGSLGTVTTAQGIWWDTIIPGTSFTIHSNDPTDTSTISWLVIG